MAGLQRVTVQEGVPLDVSGSPRASAALDPTRALRRLYRSARTLQERALHRQRHRAVALRLSQPPRPKRILVVCHGNICRSPYLQAVLQRELPDVSVMSAGFVGSNRPVPHNSLVISAQRGIDLSRFRSQLLTYNQLLEADLVIVMNVAQKREIARRFRTRRKPIVVAGDLEQAFATSRSIRDPWNESIEVFKESFDRLDRCAVALVKLLPSQ